jgi:hypothetical protein
MFLFTRQFLFLHHRVVAVEGRAGRRFLPVILSEAKNLS